MRPNEGRSNNSPINMKNHISHNALFLMGLLILTSLGCVWDLHKYFTNPHSGPTATLPSNIQSEDPKEKSSTPESLKAAPAATTTLTTTRESSATQTVTSTVIPSTTQTVTTTGTTAPACLVPLAPPDSSSFGSFGQISFSWESNTDAASYAVVVTAPNGTLMTFPTNLTEYTRWIESFSCGGEFSWQVLAFDEEGNEICRSAYTKFTKPVTEPSSTAVPRGKKEPRSPTLILTPE